MGPKARAKRKRGGGSGSGGGAGRDGRRREGGRAGGRGAGCVTGPIDRYVERRRVVHRDARPCPLTPLYTVRPYSFPAHARAGI